MVMSVAALPDLGHGPNGPQLTGRSPALSMTPENLIHAWYPRCAHQCFYDNRLPRSAAVAGRGVTRVLMGETGRWVDDDRFSCSSTLERPSSIPRSFLVEMCSSADPVT